jgi:transcriptional regulator with XRE-family HTH domain
MKMGIPRTYISKVENGKILPYTAQMRRLAAALNVTVGQLLDTSRERTVRALMEDSFIAEIASVGVGMHRFQQAVVVEAARKMANG